MRMTEMQGASLTISLSTLGQTDLTGNDPELLRTLVFLMKAAIGNIEDALHEHTADLTAGDDPPF